MAGVGSDGRPRWPSAVTVLNVAVASGFALTGLVEPSLMLPAGVAPTQASAVFAMYAAARTIPLAIAVFVAVARADTRVVLALALLAGAIQMLDGLIGLVQHDVGKTVGPFAIAALQVYAAIVLRRWLDRDRRAP